MNSFFLDYVFAFGVAAPIHDLEGTARARLVVNYAAIAGYIERHKKVCRRVRRMCCSYGGGGGAAEHSSFQSHPQCLDCSAAAELLSHPQWLDCSAAAQFSLPPAALALLGG